MVQSGTYTFHPAAFLDQPFAAPHQSFLSTGSEVPLDKKSSFPPGEAKRCKPLACTLYYSGRVPLNRALAKIRGCGRILSAPTVPGAKRRAGRLLVDPYRKHIQNRLPGGSGHQRIHTISVASLSGGTAARRQLTVC